MGACGSWSPCGFVGARFNAGLFGGAGLASDVGRALYKRCGELGMPVGIMTFGGLLPHVEAIRALAAHSPRTTMIIDHFGFFRQPATGGLLGAAASNDEEAWAALLALAELPAVHVKVSALFRVSAELPPHKDLEGRLSSLLKAYGPSRLLWGSDFPYVVLEAGGYEGSKAALEAMLEHLGASEADAAMVLGGTAQKLFFSR